MTLFAPAESQLMWLLVRVSSQLMIVKVQPVSRKGRKLLIKMFSTIMAFSMCTIAIFEGHAGQKNQNLAESKSTRFKQKNSTKIFNLKLNSKSRLSMIYVISLFINLF